MYTSLFALLILIAASAASGLASEHEYPLKTDCLGFMNVECKDDAGYFCSHVDASITFTWLLAILFFIAPGRFLYPLITEGTAKLHYRDGEQNTQWAPV